MVEDDAAPAIQTLVRAVEVLAHGRSSAEVLQRVVALAGHVVPAARQASVTVERDGALRTPAASDAVAEQVDLLQYRAGQGPCVDAADRAAPVVTHDLATEVRWPDVAGALVQRTGVRSMLSLPLAVGTDARAALNLSASRPGAFPAPVQQAGALFAQVAGLALTAAAQRELAEQQAEQVQRTEDFTTALAHDLRSRMTTLLGARDVLARRRDQLDAPGRQALDLLVEELDQQHRLLVALLDLARARGAPEPVRLLSAVQRAAGRRPQPVPVTARAGAVTALVDIEAVRLGQILANLLDNADRHAGGATSVEVGATDEQAWVAVEDAGPGIPDDQHERVFTRFGAQPARPDGSHLGLALSRQNARLSGGDVTVQSVAGGGARFLLQLPLVGDADPPA